MDIIVPNVRHECVTPLVTISSSFNRHLRETQEAIEEFTDYGAYVLSPQQPQPHSVIDKQFLLLEGDLQIPNFSVKKVQDRHNHCISISHLLWLICPDGYTGTSVCFEIGIALYGGVPIFSKHVPNDPSIACYVTHVANIQQALEMVRNGFVTPNISSKTCHQLHLLQF